MFSPCHSARTTPLPSPWSTGTQSHALPAAPSGVCHSAKAAWASQQASSHPHRARGGRPDAPRLTLRSESIPSKHPHPTHPQQGPQGINLLAAPESRHTSAALATTGPADADFCRRYAEDMQPLPYTKKLALRVQWLRIEREARELLLAARARAGGQGRCGRTHPGLVVCCQAVRSLDSQ